MDVSHLCRSTPPCIQDLPNPLLRVIVPRADSLATPSKNEIQLNNLLLNVSAAMFRKSWDLLREAHPIRANRFAQFGDRHFLYLLFPELWVGLPWIHVHVLPTA